MAQNKPFSFSVELTTVTTATLLAPPTATGGTNGGSSPQIIYLRQIRLANRLGTIQTYTLYRGAAAGAVAGTEVGTVGGSIPANSHVVLSFGGNGLPIVTSTGLLVGGANANSAITLTGEGEIGVSG